MTQERELGSLPEYRPPERDENGFDKGAIIGLSRPEQVAGLATPERVVGRRILEWSPYCGTYGQGGPGFFGLRLEASEQLPEEWLILTLWGACNWLELNDRWIEAHPNQYHIQEPLYSNYVGIDKKDEVTPLLKDKILTRFEVESKSAVLDAEGAVLELHEDPARRPRTGGTGELYRLNDDEDLRNAWIISPIPWVEV